MAKPFYIDSETILTNPITISDINIPSNSATAETDSPFGKFPDLNDLDKLFGPLRFGERTVSRQTLQALGALVNGEAITAANTYFSEPDQVFTDGLEFDPVQVEERIKSVDGQERQRVPELLYEIVTLRSPDAAPLLREMSASDAEQPMQKISKLLTATQRLDIHKSPLPEHLPGWVDKARSRGMTSIGVGLQAYGLYSAYMGVIDGLKKGQMGEVLINAGGAFAEITSLGLEYALNKTGEQMIRQGSMALEQFGKTTMGKWLCRGAGLIASVLTLPFDIYTAIKSFNDAARTQGKEAQDLYVTGGLSVFSGALSIALGCAALMGFQAAGPVGIAAAAVMIVGARIYGAARMVDDIDDYIELTVHERWRAGWFAFTGQSQDKALMDRYLVAKTTSDYSKALKTRSLGWLDNEFKESVDVIVNGRFEVKLLPTRLYRFQWNETKGETPYITKDVPVITDTDDTYDAKKGLPDSDSIIARTKSDPAKGVFWSLGGGHDTVRGVEDKPNFFDYASGRKTLDGGNKDDSFLFQSASEALSDDPTAVSALSGGDGTDLLWLQGNHRHEDHGANPPRHIGFDIDLKSGRLAVRPAAPAAEPVLHSTLDSIEKVETLAGALNRVTGSDHADIIGANGDDRVNAGAGDDRIGVRGLHGTVDGGSGSDTYEIAPNCLTVSLHEDGQEPSQIYLGVTLEAIQRWYVRNDALVIDSLRNDDIQPPMRELALEAVYRTVDGKRSLRNDKWTFITQDGYHLQPVWPAETPDLADLTVEVSVLTAGATKTSPVPVNDRPYRISNNPHSYYFISRQTHHTILTATPHEKPTRSTLYVDRDSTEIDEVRANYTVTTTKPNAFTYLSYSNVHFTLSFHQGGLLSLHGAVSENPGRKHDMGGGIMASGWQMNHPVTLVMRDGVSYHLDFPRNSYFDDAKKPGYTLLQSRASLRERTGQFLFVRPTVEKRTLKNTSQRVDFLAAEHNATYWLEGRSASYELFPASATSIRLSTADTDARVSGSSTWFIHTQHLQEQISHHDLSIKDNLLRIGSIRIQLPDSNDPLLPLETIEVVVSSGNRYRINPLFEVIGLSAIDARAYTSVQAIVQDVRDHQSREELEFHVVPVHNVRLQGSACVKISYNPATHGWSSESTCEKFTYNAATNLWSSKTTPSRPIPIEQIIIVKE
ncbi:MULTISPECIES: calcium-binding protein [Pseudomonas]|uniref:Calcium-binding protein n=1 Tax=Pseudomonas aphyarum TaxID=2942629 RepID=A0ABT5PTT4_9PSED|nr:calcium-binding protein [Pseudomonas aphyarum]MDD0968948.1 calcium-binding protein [Pseudomonas aphyarum]MDD1126901.1 calcium-binding protein [Pseudomonas aphyarum]